MALLLTEDNIKQLLDTRGAISYLERAFREQSKGNVLMPGRQLLREKDSNAVVRIMSASVPAMNDLGAKIPLGTPATRKHGSTYFVTLLFDPTDASLLAVVAANRLTQLRTGDASGIAAEHLARSGSKSLGILGAGVQGYGQLEGASASVSVESVTVYDLDAAKMDAMIVRAKNELGLDLRKAKSAGELYSNDILCKATPAAEPVIFGDSLKPGTHLNAVGRTPQTGRK